MKSQGPCPPSHPHWPVGLVVFVVVMVGGETGGVGGGSISWLLQVQAIHGVCLNPF